MTGPGSKWSRTLRIEESSNIITQYNY
jgi:hypothetical protein